MPAWFEISNAQEVPSPALLVYPERIQANIDSMLGIARASLLRPHVKTHKMREITGLCLRSGITRFKTATLVETEMAAEAGAKDVLLAYPPTGPNIQRLKQLISRHPQTRFSTLADNEASCQELSQAFLSHPLEVWVDIDCGMHRTGINPAGASRLARIIHEAPGLRLRGLHSYEGHIHASDLAERREEYHRATDPISQLRKTLEAEYGAMDWVAGGSPTFPFNAARGNVECSPGTPLLWDAGYASEFPDLPFQIAAALLCRVISNPLSNLYCLDLGHKSVASESAQPRLQLPQIPGMEIISHSEEHLVIRSGMKLPVGTIVYALPKHICPTCALYEEAVVIAGGRAGSRWKIDRNKNIKSC